MMVDSHEALALELFGRALEHPPEDRERWLDEQCAGETSLRSTVRSMLRADGRTTGALEQSVADVASDLLAREDPAEVAPEGSHVGPYRLLREAGRGGMGVVYQAYDPRLRRFVALKFFPSSLTADSTVDERLFAEARAAAALDHPNICTVYDLGHTEDGRWYIAMAYYAGQTLADRLESGAMPVSEATDMVRQILQGLAAAHDHGIVHRDVKPSNILVTSQGHVKIVDFGIAMFNRQDPLARLPIRPGTPAYMAPEQIGREEVDHRADLWAVGVLLYEMVSGRRPFLGQTVAEMFSAVTSSEPTSPTEFGCSPRLSAVVQRALAKRPDQRYQDARSFLHALDEVGATASGPKPTVDLPMPVTSFVGREAEVAELVRRLDQGRLVTLTGPGGAGKTRLSIEVARAAASFAESVQFVPLGTDREAQLVPHVVARHLGLSEAAGSPAAAVFAALEQSRGLLVLDNFEHVMAAAPFVGALVARCPRLRVLVTSRVALRVQGEQEWEVLPLSVPDLLEDTSLDELRANPAVALFVTRAQATRPDFELNEDNRSSVTELCRALDGLPLAIELAAAQSKLLTPRAIVTHLGPRMELLDHGRRDSPPRHRTLSETVAWSYDELPDEAQRLFRRLGTLSGGGSLDMVEALAVAEPAPVHDVLRALATLVDHSLVRQEETALDPRFVMLQTIRAYAAGRLDESDEAESSAVHLAHAQQIVELVERAAPQLAGSDQVRWFDRLEAERGNILAAIDWSLTSHRVDIAMRVAAAAWRLWLVRGTLAEGRDLLDRVLEAPTPTSDPSIRATVLAAVGTLAHNQGDNQRARERMAESLELYRAGDDRSGIASALTDLAWVHCELSELQTARRLSIEALTLNREIGDRRGVARALNNLGWIGNYQADYSMAREHLDEGLSIRRDIGDQRGVAFALSGLAWAELYHGNLVGADQLLADATALLEHVNDRLLRTFTLLMTARVAWHRGDLDEASTLLEQTLPLARRSGNGSLLAWAQTETGRVALSRGDIDQAAKALRAAVAGWRAISCSWGVAMALVRQAELSAVRGDRDGSMLVEAEQICDSIGDARGRAEAWEAQARLVVHADPSRARGLLGRADRLRASRQLPRSSAVTRQLSGLMEKLT